MNKERGKSVESKHVNKEEDRGNEGERVKMWKKNMTEDGGSVIKSVASKGQVTGKPFFFFSGEFSSQNMAALILREKYSPKFGHVEVLGHCS